MKQVFQDLKKGTVYLADVPAPICRPGCALIVTRRSLVSAGTERMLVEFAKGSLIQKARSQPDKVRQVLQKARTDGIAATLDAVRSKLDQPMPLGYCNAGRVVEVGPGVDMLAPGDRVVSNGPHAEYAAVPKNLVAKIPDNVSDEEAAFTVLGAVALHGIRLAAPTLGETVAVVGLGLIGLMTVQLLRANGCLVLGIDPDSTKVELAKRFGAQTVNLSRGEDPIAAARAFSRGRGVDAVLITAATKSSQPVHQAALMCRKRGRIVLVGVTGLQLSRADFYEKELTFQVSCSYGPGRYDPDYEEKGHDYPIGFVRWTEQRNFEAVLQMMASGALEMKGLVSQRFPLERAPEAYELLANDRSVLGIILEYEKNHKSVPTPTSRRVLLRSADEARFDPQKPVVGFIGAGNYASRVLIPVFKKAGAQLHTIVSAAGTNAGIQGRKFGFQYAASDVTEVLANSEINTVVVVTRHSAHAAQVLAALRAGKHVFCEKPLCLTLQELAEIEAEARARPRQHLLVAFNRRFAPQVLKMKELLTSVDQPKSLIITVNAGEIPPNHWTQDPGVGGGRLVGEACHFIDMARHLVGYPITAHRAVALGPHPAVPVRDDKVILTLEFADGSVAAIHYLANGHRGFPKERVEVFAAGRVLKLDNFRKLRGWGWKGFSKMNSWRQDKGQAACVERFLRIIDRGGTALISHEELFEVARVTIEAAQEAAATA